MSRPVIEAGAEPGFRFIDLFAGIGGMRRGFEEVGGRCVFTSEIDRFSRQTYTANFPESPPDSGHELAGDIRPWAGQPDSIPRHDVLLAGFPCQPFSNAGVAKKKALGRPHGFRCRAQGTLFFDVARILDWHRPAAFLLENVSNLERHDGGRTFRTIMDILGGDLGYRTCARVIDSSPWVPQKRRRIFIAGFREETGFSFDGLEIPPGPGPRLGSILDSEVPVKYTLGPGTWEALKRHRDRHGRKPGHGFGHSVFGPQDVARTLSARYYKDGAEILIEQEGPRPRRLTPRECARLMGFDRPGGDGFRIPVSDLQAYRQFGNSVVVPVVNAVARLMQPHIAAILAGEHRAPLRARQSVFLFAGAASGG